MTLRFAISDALAGHSCKCGNAKFWLTPGKGPHKGRLECTSCGLVSWQKADLAAHVSVVDEPSATPAPSHPLASEKPELCAVCRRSAINLGYRPWEGLPMIWTCGDLECNPFLARVYGMSVNDLCIAEKQAIEKAGSVAGEYLDGVGKTDLAALSREEWDEFLCRLIDGYQCELRRIMQSDPVPF